MKSPYLRISIITGVLLLAVGPLQASENLLTNGGFEAVENGRPVGWSVRVSGEWADKAGYSTIASISADARTGNSALCIDTTALNPGGQITDPLRTWREPKYQVLLSQKIEGVEPDCWYLLKYHVKSPQITLNEGMDLRARVSPRPPRDYKKHYHSLGARRAIRHWGG